MSADALLSRLDRLRRAGRGRWIACCPAHNDRNPSLSIRELDDGRTLLHCFAGCGVQDVLGAVGLTFADLHPERRLGERFPRVSRTFHAHDVLTCCAHELLVASVLAAMLASGVALTDTERERLWDAATRLAAAVEVCDGR